VTSPPSFSPSKAPITQTPSSSPSTQPTSSNPVTSPPSFSPSKAPITQTPSASPSLTASSSPSASPIAAPVSLAHVSVSPTLPQTTLSCLQPGQQIELPSGYVNVFNSVNNEICGIYIVKSDNSLTPYARSYDGNEWESAPGPLASPMQDIDCSTGSCSIQLPALTNTNNSYVMFTKHASPSVRNQIARFLEQVSQGQF
jgi:hypothetical protein